MRWRVLLLCLAAVLAPVALGIQATALPVRAQTGGGYDLTWNVVGSGYMFSTGDAYSLGGTIGQSDAGLLSGGSYTLSGGFWNSPPEHSLPEQRVYLPLIVKP